MTAREPAPWDGAEATPWDGEEANLPPGITEADAWADEVASWDDEEES